MRVTFVYNFAHELKQPTNLLESALNAPRANNYRTTSNGYVQ
jgi:hypothetical protein